MLGESSGQDVDFQEEISRYRPIDTKEAGIG